MQQPVASRSATGTAVPCVCSVRSMPQAGPDGVHWLVELLCSTAVDGWARLEGERDGAGREYVEA